ncbi:rhomboid family intramembrane serine protease [Natronoflexus pectinivorans]|uniref:Membrane associated rhomboid family serine protease n=1 Tax=Natronoflexus pectinivorans TaxID=682526 RepID=A0A4R2GNE2_9BACT|nr:rhomboid family intramembrane serine protease [Natronoflexus pectinivorans]TCO09215.1 membrane associated rhomboid family serine protease [Natronoflexus pectinivorans]
MFKIVGNHQKPEKRRFIHSLIMPVSMVLLMFSVHLISWLEKLELYYLGVYPLQLKGLTGIITAPFIHSGWQHLYNNSVSFFILGVTLFYFYRGVAYKVFVTIYLLAGAWLWFGGREAWHIGASGLVYGLMSFLFISGVIRRHIPLMAVTLFVIFLYGSLVWGMFPLAEYMPHSWEGHLWGFMAGITAAIVYRKEGPQKPPPPFEDEEDDDDENLPEIPPDHQNPPSRF